MRIVYDYIEFIMLMVEGYNIILWRLILLYFKDPKKPIFNQKNNQPLWLPNPSKCIHNFEFRLLLQSFVMGNICTNNFEKQEGTETIDTYKNTLQYEVQLGTNCTLSIILGHYKQHRSDSILALTESRHIQQCDAIKDYTHDPQKTIEIIINMRKSFYKAPVIKTCPYKKLLICVLPNYTTQDMQNYEQNLRNLFREVFQASKDVTLQLMNTIDGICCLPNQMILSILLNELKEIKYAVKMNLITTEKKMINLYKYELLKTQAYTVRPY